MTTTSSGIATTARSASGTGSGRVALPALRMLAGLEPELLQYKASAHVRLVAGARRNIGAVIDAVRTELGLESPTRSARPTGVPGAGRSSRTTLAGYAGEIFRLDRHEPMRLHPATPVDEADLRLHLGRQLVGEIGVLHVPLLIGDAALAASRWPTA